jgi:preprotein translocase subunit SecD
MSDVELKIALLVMAGIVLTIGIAVFVKYLIYR